MQSLADSLAMSNGIGRPVTARPGGGTIRPAPSATPTTVPPQARKETVVPELPLATILIVDDEPDVRDVLEEYLSGNGYAAIAAENASVARDVARGAPCRSRLAGYSHAGRGRIEPCPVSA